MELEALLVAMSPNTLRAIEADLWAYADDLKLSDTAGGDGSTIEERDRVAAVLTVIERVTRDKAA